MKKVLPTGLAPFFIRKSRNSRFFGYFCNLETNTLNYDKENFHLRTFVLLIPYGSSR
jgi:hypothetical protein